MRSKKIYKYTQARTSCISYHWADEIENVIKRYLEGFTLHLCSGRSGIGDVRIDKIIWAKFRSSFKQANMIADANKIPFQDNSVDTLCFGPCL